MCGSLYSARETLLTEAPTETLMLVLIRCIDRSLFAYDIEPNVIDVGHSFSAKE